MRRARGLTLSEAQLALAAIGALDGPAAATAASTLAELLTSRGLERAGEVFHGWADAHS